MTKEQASKLSQELGIDITQIVREEWEMKILKVLFDSSLGNKIFLKGGTALRLAYRSPRFSEDLDFTQIKKITVEDLKKFADDLIKQYPKLKISDRQEKFYTWLLEFKITEDFLARNFSIKIEISKRNTDKNKASNRLLTSPTTNLEVLAKVEDLENIYQEKLEALKSRRKPRDLFDIWYISQKQQKVVPKNLNKFPKKLIRQELSKFLSKNFRLAISDLEEDYGK